MSTCRNPCGRYHRSMEYIQLVVEKKRLVELHFNARILTYRGLNPARKRA